MKIEYKKLTEKELPIFIDMRIQQLREEGAKEDMDFACLKLSGAACDYTEPSTGKNYIYFPVEEL